MLTRILAAMLLVPVLVVVLLFAPVSVAAVFVGLMAVVASYEMLHRTGLVKSTLLNIVSAVMAFLVCLWSYFGCSYPVALLGIFLYVVVLFGDMMLSGLQRKASEVMVCLLTGLVFPFMLSALIRILRMPAGRYLVVIPFVMAFLSDTGAYFVGVFFGKHKMAPVISPKKSWEGFFGGIVTAILGMVLYSWILGRFFSIDVNYYLALVYGLVGSLAGVFGDLSMSVIKRQTGIKDYGNLIPGHGGILDRFDSVMMTAPLTKALLLFIGLVV